MRMGKGKDKSQGWPQLSAVLRVYVGCRNWETASQPADA